MIHARKDYNRIQDPSVKESKSIPKDEPVFLLRASDKLFLPMLLMYATLAEQIGCDSRLVQTVLAHRELATLYQMSHPPKVPDL